MKDLSLEALQASPRRKPRPITGVKEKHFQRVRSYSSDKLGADQQVEKKSNDHVSVGGRWRTQQNLDDPQSDNEGRKVSVKDFSPRMMSSRQPTRVAFPQAPLNNNNSSDGHLPTDTTKIQVLAAYFSMIDQLLLVADSKLNILANNFLTNEIGGSIQKLGKCTNNYSRHIFARVVRRLEDRFDVEVLSDTEDCHRLSDVFKFVKDEELRCGPDTLENLSKVFRIFEFSKNKVEKRAEYETKGVLRILEVLEKVCRGIKAKESQEPVGLFRKFKDFNQITNSLRAINFKSGTVTTCKFSISEFIILVQEYLDILSRSRLKDFMSDVNFTFIFMQNVQLKIRLQPLEDRYYVFVVFENIADKVALGDANSRLNFSVSLINSLSHEMFTPLHHMQWVIEGLHQKFCGDGANTAASHKISEQFKKEVESDILVIKQFGMGLSMFVQNILDFANIVNNTFELYYKKFRVA